VWLWSITNESATLLWHLTRGLAVTKVKIRRFEGDYGVVWEMSCEDLHYRIGVSKQQLSHMAYPSRYLRDLLRRARTHIRSTNKENK
jgi:hypothetical protein